MDENQRLPWWTWIVPLLLMVVGDQISLLFKYSVSSYFYLPTSIGLILVQWWGPLRVIPAVFLIGCLNNYFYGFDNFLVWIGLGLGDSLGVLISWYLFKKVAKGKFWLPDTKNTVSFLILGLGVPILFYVFNWQAMYLADKKIASDSFFEQLRLDLLGEMIVSSLVVIPTLFYVSPFLWKKKWLVSTSAIVQQPTFRNLSPTRWIEISITCLATYLFTLFFGFEDFWFILGVISLYMAIRFGFGLVLIINIFFSGLTYVVPALSHPLFSGNYNQSLYVFFGYFLLYIFSTITGRVISDLRLVQNLLNTQNQELLHTNQELDHFVYSVSHDLSAPLKSIRGLINVTRMESLPPHVLPYFSRMENSVLKLEDFIKEVLDYSRSKRLESKPEDVNLIKLLYEVWDSLSQGVEGISRDVLIFQDAKEIHWFGDRSRLKIIFNNLLSNAIKYRKKQVGYQLEIKFTTYRKDEKLLLVLEDNGEGMRPEIVSKIFTMFFRGHQQSTGSGLGLYIAREAAKKLNGEISVESQYGEGSIFTITLPIIA